MLATNILSLTGQPREGLYIGRKIVTTESVKSRRDEIYQAY